MFMKLGQIKPLFSFKKPHPNLPLKTDFFAQTGETECNSTSRRLCPCSELTSLTVSGYNKGFQENNLMKRLLWTENEGQAMNCLHCQHLADTQTKEGQKPWKEKAEKGSSASLSQQQVRTRLRAQLVQHKVCEG